MPASNVQQELWWSSTKVLHAGALTHDVIAGMHLHDTQYPLAYSWRFHLATPYDFYVFLVMCVPWNPCQYMRDSLL